MNWLLLHTALCAWLPYIKCAPNILFILADDLGFNDVSWHNENISTPHLDQLAKSGVILENSYASPICSPSRSALLSGLYPIHTGLHQKVIRPSEPVGLNENITILPQYFKDIGYSTHMIGKWHLGYCSSKYHPLSRGFDSFFGQLIGGQDYFTHKRGGALDFWNNMKPARNWEGVYSMDVFTRQTIKIIRKPDRTKPFFLYLPTQSVHEPLQVPKKFEDMYSHIKNKARRVHSGMVTALDAGIGHIVKALKDEGIFNNTIIVFTSDNGGFIPGGASNHPLRGNKVTVWEGGTRVPTFITGPGLKSGEVNRNLFYITDWFPTLLAAAGRNVGDLKDLDAENQWPSLLNSSPSPRKEFVYNIRNESCGMSGAIRVGRHKLIVGFPGAWDGWLAPSNISNENIRSLRRSKAKCEEFSGTWLFDLDSDPEERVNLADTEPQLLQTLKEKFDKYRAGMVPPHTAEPVDEEFIKNRKKGMYKREWCEDLPQDKLVRADTTSPPSFFDYICW